MKSLTVFFDYNSPSYFIPILLSLKKMDKEIVCYIVGDITKKNEYESYYELLKKNGVIFLSDDEFVPCSETVYFLDYNYLKTLYQRVGKNIITITYYHGSDRFTVPQNTYHIFTLYQQVQSVCNELGIEASYNPIKLPQVNAEIYLGGFYHYFEVFPYLNKDKKINQIKLAEKLNLNLQSDKPLISYTFGEYNREYKFIDVFKKLSEEYNFIIKVLHTESAQKLRKENLLVCDKWREPLLRIAADVNLVSLGSGSLYSSFALGLKSIPVYSEKMGYWFPFIKDELTFRKGFVAKSFSFFVNKKPIASKPYSNDFLTVNSEYFNLVPPVSLHDFEQIKSVIDNKGFWKNFEKKVDIVRKNTFGEIILEDSIVRTSNYVLSILER